MAVAQGRRRTGGCLRDELDKVVDKIRGEKGTMVRLTIIPADAADESETKEVRLIRDKIKLTDRLAKGQVIDYPEMPRLGVIDLPQFYENCARDVGMILDRFRREKVTGVVLDLRRNGGGLLPEAVKLAGLFIEQGPMVQVIDSRQRKQVLQDNDINIRYDGPMIVLVGKLSASASEIVAAALQDYGRRRRQQVHHSKAPFKPLCHSTTGYESGPRQARTVQNSTVSPELPKSRASPRTSCCTPYDYMEIGEATLPNSLAADHTDPLNYRKLNRVNDYVKRLTTRSNARIKDDQDFAYILEDINTLKERLLDKSLSLNDTTRLKEKDDEKEKRETRKKERKDRGKPEETVYDLTIKMIQKNLKLGEEVEDEEKPIRLEEEVDNEEEVEEDEEDAPSTRTCARRCSSATSNCWTPKNKSPPRTAATQIQFSNRSLFQQPIRIERATRPLDLFSDAAVAGNHGIGMLALFSGHAPKLAAGAFQYQPAGSHVPQSNL